MHSIFSSGHNGCAINLTGLEVTINGNVYYEPICIARLLTVEEIERLERFNIESPEAKAVMDEEIVSLTFESFLGITDVVNWGEIEAGIITTIADVIKLKSIQLVSDPLGNIANIQQQLNLYHSIQAIVSRFLCTPFDVVEKLPVNELMRRYAICLMTFPQEVQPPKEAEEE